MREEFHQVVREGSERGQTFLLSSHAMDEVQSLAHRVGIVRSGRLVHVDSIERLRERARRLYEIEFRLPPSALAFEGLNGVELRSINGHTAHFEVSGTAEELMRACSPFGIHRVESGTPDLGRIFLSYYETEGSLHPTTRAKQHAA